MMLRKAPVGLVLGAFATPASATLLLYEPFDYAAVGTEISTADGAGGWLKVPSGATAEPTVAAGSLSYVGLPFAPVGNKVTGNSTGTGVLASSTLGIPGAPYVSSAEPTLYYSLLLNVSNVSGLATSAGSFIAGFRSTTGTGGLAGGEGGAPLLLRQTASGSGLFNLGTGLTQDTADRVWGTDSYSAATGTMLLVFSYQFISGDEDFAKLWVNPDPNQNEANNAANLKVTATATDGQGITGGQITNFFLRNNGSAPDGWDIDELRVSSSWEGLWGTTPQGIWLGGTGNWSDSTKWSAATVPNLAAIPVQIDKTNAAASVVTLDQDASVRSVTLDADDVLNINSGRTLTLAQLSTLSGVVNSSGTITAPDITVIEATAALNWIDGEMNLGRLQLRNGAKMTMSPGQDKTLVIASNSTIDVADLSELDVADNKVVVQGGDLGTWNGTTYTGVTGLVDVGRNTGAWDGPGIVTSMTDATTSILTSLAVAKASELFEASPGVPIGPTDTVLWGGKTIDGDDVLVMYTWGGDAELDGDLDGDDYFWIDSNIALSGTSFGYHQGDFDYDGDIDGDDYFIIDSNIAFASTQPPFPTGGGASGLAVVPEPAGVALLGAAALGLRRRRRR